MTVEKTRSLGMVAIFVAVLAILGGCGPKPHLVHISSEPAGAVVFLNDRVIGETPLDPTIRQRDGDYNIYTFKALKEEYKPVKQAFKEQLYHQTAADVIPAQLNFVLEERKKYPIAVTSAPSGAVVTLNGEVVGETPCTVTIRERIGEPRIFDFVAVKEGYEQGQKVLREFAPQANGAVFEFPQALHFELTAASQ